MDKDINSNKSSVIDLSSFANALADLAPGWWIAPFLLIGGLIWAFVFARIWMSLG